MKPTVPAALTTMIDAAAILTDPIFDDPANSMLSGLASSTQRTVPGIPAIECLLLTGAIDTITRMCGHQRKVSASRDQPNVPAVRSAQFRRLFGYPRVAE